MPSKTNSGRLARIMNDPNSGYRKIYRARVHGLITESKLKGLIIDGVKQAPMEVKVERTANTISWMRLDIQESRQQRQIKNSMKSLYLSVTRLMLTEYGPYKLTQLLPENTYFCDVPLSPDTFKEYITKR